MEAAFFDLDKTVIARASMVAFSRPLYRHGMLSRWLLLRALYGQLVYLYLGADENRMARMQEVVVRLTKGWPEDRIRAIVRETLEEVVEPIVYAEAVELIKEHREAGRLVYIVSASPVEIVEPLAEHLDTDGCIATRSRLDEDGCYAGEIDFYAYGPGKAEAIRSLAAERDIDLEASFAYSDSATDLPMLEVVGHPVAVNPDRDLLRAAREREWEIRTFTNPVRLRDRVPFSPAGQTAIGGVVAMLVAGGVVWWWLRRDPSEPPQPTPPARWARLVAAMAEVDGNRTRRRGITTTTRFEGGGAHQVPRHLRFGR